MDYMREISTFLEDRAIVTANWLSQELQVSVRKAIELIQEYKSSKSESIAHYRIVYRDEVGGIQVTTITDADLVVLQEAPNLEVLSQQIYSVSKVNSALNHSLIVDSALSQAEELLKSTVATQGSFLTNSSGEIHLSGFEIRGVGDRIFSSQNILFKAPSLSQSCIPHAPPVLPLKTATVSSSSTNKENKATPTTNTAPVPSTQSSTLKKINKTNEDAAKKFFGAFVGAPKPLDPVLEDRYVEGAGDDEEEWDDGRVKLADRKQIIKKLASDEVMDFSSQEAEAEKTTQPVVSEDGQEESVGKKRKAKTNVLTRGAMDDYMEDVAIEEYKRKQEEEASGAPPMKKKKRVLVEKSFMDSDGYFVTEMVWDEVTDDESDALANNAKALEKMAPSSNASKENNPTNEMKRETSQGNKQPLKPKPQAKSAAASTGGQKSMMSFFTKKA